MKPQFEPLSSRSTVLKVLLAGVGLLLVASAAGAQVSGEVAYVFNTYAFLVWGAFIMWMCAGFTMLEAGSVRTKNASVICMKNIGLYSIAGLAYYVIGYNIMYVDVDGGFFGSISLFRGNSASEIAFLSAAPEMIDQARETLLAESDGYATMSDWFFQMVFVATTASIISGTLAERVRLWSFFLFVAILTACIYPIVGAWTWGAGWLSEMGFQDFAGSTIVHSTGGWAALSGAMLLGARRGRFRKDGTIRQLPPSNVPIVTLGVFILWLGWFGFNGGSQLALSSATDALALSNIFANTNIAAAAGVVAALVLSKPILGRMDLLATLNGAIAGLVAITAGPDLVDHQWAILIGGVGGAVTVAGTKLLETVRVDDVVGAIPAHLFAGIWGTLAVCIAAGGNLFVQLTGIVAIGIFVFAVSTAVWMLIDRLIGLRVSPSAEQLGQDVVELGIEAYPEFVAIPEPDDDDD
jgi:Amt family ammonium transporter